MTLQPDTCRGGVHEVGQVRVVFGVSGGDGAEITGP